MRKTEEDSNKTVQCDQYYIIIIIIIISNKHSILNCNNIFFFFFRRKKKIFPPPSNHAALGRSDAWLSKLNKNRCYSAAGVLKGEQKMSAEQYWWHWAIVC